MKRSELSGLVLTHGRRDPSIAISQLSNICEQVIVVQDSRYGNLDSSLIHGLGDDFELTLLDREFDSFPGQRNAGIERATGQWVLSLDSDERLTAELGHEITALEPPENAAIYGLPNKEIFHGKQLRVANPSGLLNALHPRLFRSNLRYAPQPLVHERFVDEQQYKILPLSASIEHLPNERMLARWLKSFKYGQLRALQTTQRGDFEYPDFLANLRHYILEDGIGGAAMVGMKIAYGLGVKTSRTRNR